MHAAGYASGVNLIHTLINCFVDHPLWNSWRSGDKSFISLWDIAS